MKSVKELRSEMGLSQQKFGDKFGIPKPTIESWEYGVRTAPEYVMELLLYKAESEKIRQTAYVVRILGDGISEYQLFPSRFDAIEKCKASWDKLTEEEKTAFWEDPDAVYGVVYSDVKWDDGDKAFVPDFTNEELIWSAI